MRTPPAGAAHVAGFVRLLVLRLACDCRELLVAPQPPHAPMLSAVMPNGQAAPGAGRCAPHWWGCTTLRDTLPVDPTRASGDRLEVSWTGPEVGTRPRPDGNMCTDKCCDVRCVEPTAEQ